MKLFNVKNLIARFRKDEKGVTLVEYGIALILAVGVGTLALTNLSTAVQDKMGEAETQLAPQATGGTGGTGTGG